MRLWAFGASVGVALLKTRCGVGQSYATGLAESPLVQLYE